MLSLIVVAAAAAQVPPADAPAPAAARAPARQIAFDAAMAAADRQDWEGAERQFGVLEAQLARGKSARSLSVVRMRRGEALLKLGRNAEAEASVRLGIGALPDGSDLRDDRVYARLILAEIAESRFDYPAAHREFTAAHADAAGTTFETRALVGRIRSGTFVDARAAAAMAEGAVLTIMGQDKAAKQRRADMRTLKGRALLNTGDFAGALAELSRANSELGGLTTQVNYSDLVTRSDLALAALLSKKPEKAREYLAYTGAGRLGKKGLPAPSFRKLPACGGETGLRADDVAVVEVAIRDDGGVMFARPIYASRPQAAAPFAKATSRWTWSADAIAKLPALFRLVTRLELRCRQGPESVNVFDYLSMEHDRWTTGDPRASSTADPVPLAMLRSRLVAANGGPVRTRLATMRAMVGDASIDKAEADRTAMSALDVARSGEPPANILAYWLVWQAFRAAGDPSLDGGKYSERIMAALDTVSLDPLIADDARSRAAVAMLRADVTPEDRVRREAEPMLRRIANDPALEATDELKLGAKVRLARLSTSREEHEEARRLYAGAGLPPSRCPVLDVSRGYAKLKATSSDFPNEALAWGFEGWSDTEVTIDAAGRASDARTLLAYPPFVFGKAGEAIARNSRYQPSFRAASEAACGGQSQRVSYRLP